MGIEILVCAIFAFFIINIMYWILKPFMNTIIEIGEKIAPYTLIGRLIRRARKAAKEDDSDMVALCTLAIFVIIFAFSLLFVYFTSK